jgi:hypothetical protein
MTDSTKKMTTIPASTARQEQAGTHEIEKRIRENVRRGEAIAGNVLYEAAYKGLKKATNGTFLVHISNARKKLRQQGTDLVSTTWYRLVDYNKK